MRMKLASVIMAASLAVTLTGCVKVIDKGTEGQYTGEVEFDASADSSNDWEKISSEIEEKAEDLTAAMGSGIGAEAVAVKGAGTVKEFITKGPKNILSLEIEGYDGPETFMLQIGSVYSGTALRDVQTVKNFESFTNQTEWSQYAKAVNAQMHEQVVAPLALDDSCVGKKVTFTGSATQSGSEVTITPSALTVE